MYDAAAVMVIVDDNVSMEIDSVGGGYDAFIFHKGAVCCPCGA
jgi:hypothetical protein